MNWYKREKAKEAASVIHVSPQYQGKDKGTKGPRPMQIQDNPRVFGTDTDLAAKPEHWEALPWSERIDYVSNETSKGRTHFPAEVRDFGTRWLNRYPDKFYHSLVVGFSNTGRFPDYAAGWLQKSYRNNTLPPEMQKIVENQLNQFPDENRGVNLLVQDQPRNAPLSKDPKKYKDRNVLNQPLLQ
jgi:hypothetical protein